MHRWADLYSKKGSFWEDSSVTGPSLRMSTVPCCSPLLDKCSLILLKPLRLYTSHGNCHFEIYIDRAIEILPYRSPFPHWEASSEAELLGCAPILCLAPPRAHVEQASPPRILLPPSAQGCRSWPWTNIGYTYAGDIIHSQRHSPWMLTSRTGPLAL